MYEAEQAVDPLPLMDAHSHQHLHSIYTHGLPPEAADLAGIVDDPTLQADVQQQQQQPEHDQAAAPQQPKEGKVPYPQVRFHCSAENLRASRC